jgi:uncharacterized protein
VVPVIVRAKAKNGRIVYGRIYADTAKGRDVVDGVFKHPSRLSGSNSRIR